MKTVLNAIKCWVEGLIKPINSHLTYLDNNKVPITRKINGQELNQDITIATEPEAYIKNASVAENTLTLTKKDNTSVVFSPSGMPDPSEMEDGTAMVVVDGEWTEQEGYGYDVSTPVTFLDNVTLSDWQEGELVDELHRLDGITVGNTYTVIWGGTSYSCVAFDYNSVPCIGNRVFIEGEDTGEPFFAANLKGQVDMWIADQTISSVVVTVTGSSVVTTRIDSKYLVNSAILNGSQLGSIRTLGTRIEGEGYTIGVLAFAEGNSTKASGMASHAEGDSTVASGASSHAECYVTIASGSSSHAEGGCTTASGSYSHAEGTSTTASGNGSHAEGNYTTVSGYNSHAEGNHTTASGNNQHVQGEYNVEDSSSVYADIVGNGSSDNARSNASALDWSGNLRLHGDVYVNCNDDSTGGTLLGAATWGNITGTLSNQTDLNTALTNKQDKIPTITLSLTQVTSQNPLTIQFTNEQAAIIDNDNNALIYFNLAAFDKPSIFMSNIQDRNNTRQLVLNAEKFAGGATDTITGYHNYLIVYKTTTKVGVFSEFVFEPDAKTSSMTTPVGIDESGKFWTSSGSSLPTTTSLLKGDGAGGASVATAGTDYAPAYQYSTTDLTAGTSSLATGTLYFVYE